MKNRAYGVDSHKVSILSTGIDGISPGNRFLTTKKLCLAKVVDSVPTPSIFSVRNYHVKSLLSFRQLSDKNR
jgi:hypothetical protein